jgi:hypothetical protein
MNNKIASQQYEEMKNLLTDENNKLKSMSMSINKENSKESVRKSS